MKIIIVSRYGENKNPTGDLWREVRNVPEVGNIDSLCTGIALDVVSAGVGPAFDLYAALNFFVFFVWRNTYQPR